MTRPLNIVLVEPEIPQNTGNIARTCACTGARLHLVEPMGFRLTQKNLARAGCDYWDEVDIVRWPCAEAFFEAHAADELHLFTGQACRGFGDVAYGEGSFLVFGRESRGLPLGLIEAHANRCVRIPMREGLRSLNLSNAVAILAYEALRQKVHWINGGLPEDGHGAMPDRGAADRETESLSAFLCDQLERRRLPKPLLALTRYLAELVDEEGRLSQEDLDGVADLKIPQALTQQALETLQSLDPAGVGARSLSECLLLQLARQDAPSPLDMEIVRRFLPDLGKKHYSLIARELHTTPEEVRAAEKRISALDPCPGRSFQPAEPTLYVRPDLFIAELDGKLQVILNDYYLPRVSISQYYVRLLKESDEPETRAYLQQKMQQAKWLLNSLERRGSTLRQCAEAILETQRAFFAGQTTELVPMTMVTLAERLHLHPSTVSRATREKYLQCRQGTYPLRYFFSRALGEQGPSQQTVKLRLLELIRQEDHSRPLSDQKLAELLAEQGIRIARRTVAKYRTELRLGSAAARKRD